MTPIRWIQLTLSLLLLSALSLFVVQNYGRTTDLSFDLYVWAAHLGRPAPVPLLLLTAFVAGGGLAGIWGLVSRWRLGQRVEELEQELARLSLRSGPGDSSTAGAARSRDDDPWA